MTDAEIADNLITFLTAGHETTAQALTWTLHLLAAHPAVEAALVAEVASRTDGAPIGAEHVGALVTARQVVSEAMRLYPPVPMIVRWVQRPFGLAGIEIPDGTAVIVPIYALHRRQALWPDPERFDPSRFAPDARRHRYAYLPFGAGPRVCIGASFAMAEAVAILATLLPAVRFGRVGAAMPRPVMAVTLRPAEPLIMTFSPRSGGR